MIGITVRYFAAFREQANRSSETLTTGAGTVSELFGQLAERHGFADPMGRCKVAINDEMADWNAPVRDGDVVLFFPPVAGG
jgi:molybdopterin converting factor subunit 1